MNETSEKAKDLLLKGDCYSCKNSKIIIQIDFVICDLYHRGLSKEEALNGCKDWRE